MNRDLLSLLPPPRLTLSAAPPLEATSGTGAALAAPVPPATPTKRGRIRKTFRVFDGEGDSRLVTVIGRDAWMLGKLVDAGGKGCTTLEQPAPRTSHYIWKLRHTYGIGIASIEEEHGGAYAGRHVRYILQQRVEFADEGGAT